ncbi:MAG: hypothetical protein J0H72_08230, partial [Burkholderiales bacterium]|nr:hypothetical protein [Burkholderiales bacterium]
ERYCLYCFVPLPFAALSCLALRHQQRNEIMKKFFTSVKSSLAAVYYAATAIRQTPAALPPCRRAPSFGWLIRCARLCVTAAETAFLTLRITRFAVRVAFAASRKRL